MIVLTEFMLCQISALIGCFIAFAIWGYQENNRPRKPEEILKNASIPLLEDQDL